MRRTKNLVVGLFSATVLCVICGCSSNNAAPLTKQEEKEFKGGPMPPAARDEMAKRLAEANKKAPANTPSNVGPK